MNALVAVLGAVVAVLAVLVVGLLRSHADILRRLHALDGVLPGADVSPSETPSSRTLSREEVNTFPQVHQPPERDEFPEGRDLIGVGVNDDALTIRVTEVSHRTLVAFLSSGCLTCQRFWDAFSKPHKLGLPADVRPVIVTKGPDQESPAKVAQIAPNKVPVIMTNDAWGSYDVPGSPYFVLVDGRTGAVQGEGTGIDWPQVKGLLDQVSTDMAYAEELDDRRSSKYRADIDRERKVDDELLNAGINPGDPSLYGVDDQEDSKA